MKIAFPIINAGTGSNIYYKLLKKTLSEEGHIVELIQLPPRYEFIPGLANNVKKHLENFDIIHSNADFGCLFKLKKKHLVITQHHDVFDQNYISQASIFQKIYYYSLLKQRIALSFKHADAIVMPSQYTLKQSSITYKFSLNNAEVIYNGIDNSLFSINHNKERVKGMLLFVGTPSIRKGFGLLTEIIQKLYKSGYFLVCICDRPKHIPESDHLIFTGRISQKDLIDKYRQAECFVFPSKLEGFGYSVLEAALCGCPVICSNSSSLPEVLNGYNNATLLNDYTSDEYVNAIKKCRTNIKPPETKTLIDNFDLKTMGARYIEIYERLLNNKK